MTPAITLIGAMRKELHFVISTRQLENILMLSRIHRRRETLALKKMCDTVFMLLLAGAGNRSGG